MYVKYVLNSEDLVRKKECKMSYLMFYIDYM